MQKQVNYYPMNPKTLVSRLAQREQEHKQKWENHKIEYQKSKK